MTTWPGGRGQLQLEHGRHLPAWVPQLNPSLDYTRTRQGHSVNQAENMGLRVWGSLTTSPTPTPIQDAEALPSKEMSPGSPTKPHHVALGGSCWGARLS